VIQLKITSLIRFTQGHEVSVADFYLAFESFFLSFCQFFFV
jgi:hypothetical protein